MTLTHDTDNIDGIGNIKVTVFNTHITYVEMSDNINHLKANKAVGGTLISQDIISGQHVL